MMCGEDFFDRWEKYQPPISFVYNSADSEDLLPQWIKSLTTNECDGYSLHVIEYLDPKTALSVKIEIKKYHNYTAFDWVVYFENKGTVMTPILKEINAISYVWVPDHVAPVDIHYAKGSQCAIDDFFPQIKRLENLIPFEMRAQGGRSSTIYLPFARIESGTKRLIVSLGWTGQWFMKFVECQMVKEQCPQIIIEAGMENCRLRLEPNERIRTPRVLLFFGEGETFAFQNAYRRLLFAHYSPKIAGIRAQAPVCYPTWGGNSIEEHLDRLRLIQTFQLPYEYYWIDAGWFVDEQETKLEESAGAWAKWVGRWRPNKKILPNGLKPVGKAIHKAGLKFLLWFEPERARRGTDLPEVYPNWFLEKSKQNQDLLLNLGLKEARDWLIDFLGKMIKDAGIDCYRQDFNFEPLEYWRKADSPERQGITEIRHIMGLYEVWDALLAQFPHLLIDNCASGGRRIDLETMSRSIPLWRSDFQCFLDSDPIGSQIHTYGIMGWVPLSTTGTQIHPEDDYAIRSAYSTGLVFHHFLEWDKFDELKYNWDWHHKMLREFLEARPYFEGDYYPLANVSTSQCDWLVYQCHRPDLEAGIVVAFRRKASPFIQAQFPLHGLKKDARYKIRNSENPDIIIAGNEIMVDGLSITLHKPRSSIIFFYNRIKSHAGGDSR
jgi:alpha-galactosidase